MKYVDQVINLAGIQIIGEDKFLIQLCGYPPKCKNCSGTGHTSSRCSKPQVKNYASAHLKSQNTGNQDEEDYETDFVNTDLQKPDLLPFALVY